MKLVNNIKLKQIQMTKRCLEIKSIKLKMHKIKMLAKKKPRKIEIKIYKKN